MNILSIQSSVAYGHVGNAVLAATAERGRRDLALVAAQEALVAPPEVFAAERLR